MSSDSKNNQGPAGKKSKRGKKRRGKGGSSGKRNYIRGRNKNEKVKSARGRKGSSTRWLKRQLNDPYVQEAKERGYRSRAVFKLMEIDDKYRFLKPGAVVVDLGMAPGSWAELAVERIKPKETDGRVVGVDLLETEALDGVDFLKGDFTDPETVTWLNNQLKGRKVDAVLSDMAANTTGHQTTDHLKIIALAESAWQFAAQVLAPGGIFLTKLFQGGAEADLLVPLKQNFKTVKHLKPQASRNDSSEVYLFAQGYKERVKEDD